MYNRIVVGLTTIPSRVKYLMPIVRNMQSQTLLPTVIYISVPEKSAKASENGATYPIDEMKKTFAGLAQVNVVDKDYGPLTKLMGMLLVEPKNKGTLLITIDDDQIYDKTFIENIVEGASEHYMEAVGFCGHIIGKWPFVWGFRCSRADSNPVTNLLYLTPGSKVNILSGWCGCAYPRDVFPDKPFHNKQFEKELFRNDDLYISCWLNELKIPKRVIAYRNEHVDIEYDYAKEGALSSGDAKRTLTTMTTHAMDWFTLSKKLQSAGLLESDISVEPHKSTVFVAGVCLTVTTLLVFYGAYKILKK